MIVKAEQALRQDRFLAAQRRYEQTGSPAARVELHEARLDLEAHGETPSDEGNDK